jgi:hypothetical protein
VSVSYLYADEASREILSNDLQKIALIGGDTGNTNFGDVLQTINSISIAKHSKRFATVCIMAVHAIAFKEFPACSKEHYGADAVVFVADYPLTLDDCSPCIKLVGDIRNLAVIHLYGGGFLNNMWGDYVLGIAEYFLRLVPDAAYLVSGQQVVPPYQSRVVEHINNFQPKLFGVRDELSQRWLREEGFNADFSFDDATESLLDLTKTLPLQPGAGLLMHVNPSDHNANDALALGLRYEVQKLKSSRWAQDGITLFQALPDPRHEVCDARETLKKLDAAFPRTDLRLIELASLVCACKKAHAANPIFGEIGYSCSYHVTLWLQLAGIPCWLSKSNYFYDQNSTGLQITQKLESFLEEPRPADHRSNLERRTAWNEKLQSILLQLPDAINHCTLTDAGNGPAPWAFAFKGRPTPDEKLDKAEKSERLHRARAKGAEHDLAWLRSENAELHGRLEALSAQLTEVGDEAHRQRGRAEAAEHDLASLGSETAELRGRVEVLSAQLSTMIASRSWNLTRALRVLGRLFRGEFGVVQSSLRQRFTRGRL